MAEQPRDTQYASFLDMMESAALGFDRGSFLQAGSLIKGAVCYALIIPAVYCKMLDANVGSQLDLFLPPCLSEAEPGTRTAFM